ncbi:toprim domain-containing protein [Intestinimonas sp. MSJ-38]|nr:toprim domain-containing protein [Intestinimonas sp. MSJ-38]MBU5433233.1 toprim domain-containing protein [Intestinimonas sp. MSJ-38]
MQIARETDLPDLLTHLGYQVKRIGQYHTAAEMDSLRIKDRRTWFRYSQGIGGDAITFLQQFCDKTFPEAVEYLLTFQGKARDAPVKTKPVTKQDEPPKEFALPPRNVDDRRVFAYLRKRGIAPQVILQFLNSGLLYEDAEYHNCVFVGKDATGQAKYAGLRGTYDQNGKGFRGDVTGSDKRVGFALPYDRSSDQVFVFEAPIDLMSYLTLHRNTQNALALCGLYDGALQAYLRNNPQIKRIVLCLDMDTPGQETAEQLRKKYAEMGYEISQEKPRIGKDWNEYLQKRKVLERGR